MNTVLNDFNRSVQYNVFEFSPLTYLRTWPDVSDIRIPRYTRCRYQLVYQILGFSNISLHHCGCGTIANFFGDWVTWPGLVTWPDVTWSQNFHKGCEKVSKWLLHCVIAKNLGKGESQTPRVERKLVSIHNYNFVVKNQKLKERRPLPFFDICLTGEQTQFWKNKKWKKFGPKGHVRSTKKWSQFYHFKNSIDFCKSNNLQKSDNWSHRSRVISP